MPTDGHRNHHRSRLGKVVPTAIDRVSRGRGRCNRSRLGQTRPPPLSSRAVTVAAALVSRAATRRHRLGPPHADIAWDHRSCLAPLEVAVDVRSPRRLCLVPPLADIVWGRRSRLASQEVVVVDVRAPLSTTRTSRGRSRCRARNPNP